MGGSILLVLLIGGIVFFVCQDIYNSTPHKKWTDNAKPDIEATATKVSHDIVGNRTHRRVRTTVYFNDGFRYISHKTNVEPNLNGYKISMSQEILNEIVESAEKAHNKAVIKKLKKSK